MGRFMRCFKWGRPLIFGLLLITLGLAVFADLARTVVLKQAFGFDRSILTWLATIASDSMTKFMLAASDSASLLVLGPLLLLLAVLWWRRNRYDWIALVTVLVGAFVINQVVKQVFERARPSLFPHLQVATGYSFPSGHSQAALAFYSVLAYLVARRVAPKWRIPIYIAAALWILIVGLSRNYLEVHFPSDVLAAFAITLPWALAVIFVHQCYAPPVVGEEKVIKPNPGAGATSPSNAD